MTTNFRPARAASLALALLVFQAALPGCFGRFALTRKVYALNESVNDKFLRSIVTFAMVLIPVYGVCAFADWAIFNTIEFWGGSNPVDGQNSDLTRNARPVQTASRDGKLQLEWAGDSLRVSGTDKNGLARELVMTMDERGAVLREGDRVLSQLRYDAAGNAQLLDADGAAISTLDTAEISRLTQAARLGQLGDAMQVESARLAKR